MSCGPTIRFISGRKRSDQLRFAVYAFNQIPGALVVFGGDFPDGNSTLLKFLLDAACTLQFGAEDVPIRNQQGVTSAEVDGIGQHLEAGSIADMPDREICEDVVRAVVVQSLGLCGDGIGICGDGIAPDPRRLALNGVGALPGFSEALRIADATGH
ncbi:MAG: hypothetical protein AAF967_14150 [Pseudomonadota bacterium]